MFSHAKIDMVCHYNTNVSTRLVVTTLTPLITKIPTMFDHAKFDMVCHYNANPFNHHNIDSI